MIKIRDFIRFSVDTGISKSDDLFREINSNERQPSAHLSSSRNHKSCRFDGICVIDERCFQIQHFLDVHCADQSRVILQKTSFIKSDFIHANRLPISDQFELILTQLPLPRTVLPFWQMVWQEHVETILLILTKHEFNLFASGIGLIPEM